MGLPLNIDPLRLDEAGWGVIFASDVEPAVREALAPLLQHRRSQAAKHNELIWKVLECRSGESVVDFLARHGVGVGSIIPERIPYYLLIVGDPNLIPFRFQTRLSVEYAVGRIFFDAPEEYARYAQSVIEAESKTGALAKRAVLFGAENPDDEHTRLTANMLVRPLANQLAQGQTDWEIETVLGSQATKLRLSQVMGGVQTPAVLFTACHGVAFPSSDPRQESDQGALLCQNWPGPRAWRSPIPADFYFSHQDVGSTANLQGTITVHFASYSAATPEMDELAFQALGRSTPLARQAFIAGLPKRLLSHPQGGALAFVGLVDRAYTYSFNWAKSEDLLIVYEDLLKRLMAGQPIGKALEEFGQYYAAIATALSREQEEMDFGKTVDNERLARLWMVLNDACNYIILGDPAVRLQIQAVDPIP
jgi:hypothetical protein